VKRQHSSTSSRGSCTGFCQSDSGSSSRTAGPSSTEMHSMSLSSRPIFVLSPDSFPRTPFLSDSGSVGSPTSPYAYLKPTPMSHSASLYLRGRTNGFPMFCTSCLVRDSGNNSMTKNSSCQLCCLDPARSIAQYNASALMPCEMIKGVAVPISISGQLHRRKRREPFSVSACTVETSQGIYIDQNTQGERDREGGAGGAETESGRCTRERRSSALWS
jgi:hypothetical protein